MLLLMGADNTAMAEFDSCGGREAARLAAAEGDSPGCCCCCHGAALGAWQVFNTPGSTWDSGMVLPDEACKLGEVCQAGVGWLGGTPAKGVRPLGGAPLAANGEAIGEPASGAPCSACWEYLPEPDEPGMLNCLGRRPDGSEPYAERGELARSMGMGGRR